MLCPDARPQHRAKPLEHSPALRELLTAISAPALVCSVGDRLPSPVWGTNLALSVSK